jgi:hypothetical protein
MANRSQGQIVVPLWTILTMMGTIAVSAWVWLFHRVMDLQDQIHELWRLCQQPPH